MKHTFSFFLLLAIVSCSSTKEDVTTYFGGKIINPKTNYVILLKMEKVIDTFFLDKNNKFIGKIDSIQSGLYQFIHGNEHQSVYFEPQDSLLIRLNTFDFDESLVFSGKGAKRNNMLIDCFLEAEKDNKKFYKNYSLSPKKIKTKTDSLLLLKENLFNDFINNNPDETVAFQNILNIALMYPIYSKLERYIRANNACEKNHKKELELISDTFYQHRKKVDINIDELMYYSTYSSYVIHFLYNLAYEKTRNFSQEFTINLLTIIDEKITSEKIKNELLHQTIISHFFKKSNLEDYNKAVYTFFKLNTNIDHKKLVQRLLNDTKKVTENTVFPSFQIIDFNNTKQPIKNLIKSKNTFLYFWSSKYSSKSYVTSRILYLKNKYPNVKFLQILIDGTPKDIMKKLDIKTQFYIDSTSGANKFLSSKIPRIILINNKGIVTTSYTTLSSEKIYKQLDDLTKN